MLCLHDSIRDDDPSVQCLLRAVEQAPSLTALILATWQVVRVLAVHLIEAVLTERARQPGRLASLRSLWDRVAEQGLCPAPDKKSVRAYPLAPPRRAVSPRVRHPTGGPLG